MKKTKLLYWVITIIFAAYMLFTAIPNVMQSKDSIAFIHDMLGYPVYFITFIGIAKVLGSIVLLIPGLRKLKEWAYAGLLFDLAGATYSIIAVSGVSIDIIFMVLPVIFLFLSYYLWHKTQATT